MKTIKEPENYTVKSDVNKLGPAILEVMDVAKSHGVESWLCYGALLGLVREGRLLPWNNDAELGCWYEKNISERLCSITDSLNRKGYHTNYYSSNGSIAARKKGVIVNLNCFWRENDYAVRPHESPGKLYRISKASYFMYWLATLMGTYPKGPLGGTLRPLTFNEAVRTMIVSTLRLFSKSVRRKFYLFLINKAMRLSGSFQKTGIPLEYLSDFEEMDFYGCKVRVPGKPERILKCIYGEEWRVPKTDWSFYHEKNKVETGIIFFDEAWNYSNMETV